MTNPKSVPQPDTAKGAAKVVVFGFDDNDRTRAAWFPHDQATRVRAAAKQLRLNVIDVANGTAANLVGKLPAGQIHAAGLAMVPAVRPDLYEKLVTAINGRGEAGRGPGDPVVADLPDSWDAIKPGHLVLYHESLGHGWWEAIVISRTGDKVTLRLRDYPAYPNFTLPVTDIALVHPKAA